MTTENGNERQEQTLTGQPPERCSADCRALIRAIRAARFVGAGRVKPVSMEELIRQYGDEADGRERAEREKKVLRLAGTMTHKRIAAQLGISRSYVTRLIARRKNVV